MSPLDRRPHITDRMMPEVIYNPPPDRIAFHTSPVFELQFCVRNNHKSVLHAESDRFISAFQVCFHLQLVHILQESVDYQGPSPCERDSGKTHKALPPATPHKVSDHHPDIYLLWYPSTYRHPYQSSTWPSIPIAASTIGEPVGIMCGCTGPVGISPLDLVHCAIDNVVGLDIDAFEPDSILQIPPCFFQQAFFWDRQKHPVSLQSLCLPERMLAPLWLKMGEIGKPSSQT